MLAATDIKAAEGGVAFAGPWELAYQANLESRIASRILWQIATFPYKTEEDVYQGAHALDWAHWFTAKRTIRVNVAATRCPLPSLDFVTLRIKDAICDRFRAHGGQRPTVDTVEPDIRIHAFLTANHCTLYLDTSGAALFKRGYRREAGAAPLRENLAAGILRLTGWASSQALFDPMCGSGTFLIEGAMIAFDIAPGMARSFAFEKLLNFDQTAWGKLQAAVRGRENRRQPLTIYGSDLYGDVLKIARANLAAAGLQDMVQLKQVNALDSTPPVTSGIIVTNPPYGVRLDASEEFTTFYPKLGDALKQRFPGWRAYILSADLQLQKQIRLAPAKRTPLFNGALECRLFEFQIVAGSMRSPKAR